MARQASALQAALHTNIVVLDNLVERLFAKITRQQIRRGVFKSVAELEAAIETWLTEHNAKPKPFKWTAKANIILEKNARARRALEEDLAAGTK